MATYDQSIQRTPGTDPLVPKPLRGTKMAHPDVATMRKLQTQGKAMPPAKPGGRPRFQIRNASELDDAIKAVGRARPNDEATRAKVRRFIMTRAKALGLSSRIPDTWNTDGTLKDGGDDSSSSGPGQSGTPGAQKADPDHDGDNDATPTGDTDHDYWTPGGRQKKPLPGRPLRCNGASGTDPRAARIFTTRPRRGKAA